MSLSPVRTAESLTLTWMFADGEACQIWFLGQSADDADDDDTWPALSVIFLYSEGTEA